ncbi:MAG: FAD binding domain-containing protein [Blastocatellales bacterium]|nr:FAD binding domain-containing protein [Blastocatellales bacterium]
MQKFEYVSPTTKEQAVALLGENWGDVEVLAGGTDLLSLMKDYITTPRRVVNLKGIAALSGVRYSASGLRLGALATFDDVLSNTAVRRNYPAIWAAVEGVTSPQIRAMGTVGGDLCQRPRCWYYRAGYGLLAKDETGHALVPDGDNRYHAILGHNSGAYFVNPSSLAPALIALAAKIGVYGPKGARQVDAAEFFRAPGGDGEREYQLSPNEIVTEVLVPAPGGMKNATYEVRQREALDWPLTSASVALKLTGRNVGAARIALGHVAPVPWRAGAAESALVGKAVTEQTAAAAAEAALADAKPLSRNAYKVQLARVAVKRAILAAAG